jgi:hypothetical protein
MFLFFKDDLIRYRIDHQSVLDHTPPDQLCLLLPFSLPYLSCNTHLYYHSHSSCLEICLASKITIVRYLPTYRYNKRRLRRGFPL